MAQHANAMELNRVERRSLIVASCLVALGAAVRLQVGPGEATWAWRPPEGANGSLDSTRARVEREIARAARIATPLAEGERLDPNEAPDEELQRLPGIGPGKAAAIIEARRDDPFHSAEELTRVPGLGPVTVERLKPHLRFAPAVPVRGPPGPVEGEAAAPGHDPTEAADLLDLNRAGVADLERLPGLGPVRARAIVEYRTRNGPFRSVDHVTAVPGIGPALLERLRPFLRAR